MTTLFRPGAVLAPVAVVLLLLLSLFLPSRAAAVADVAAPSLTVPAASTTLATSSQGATISFIAVATDNVDPTMLACSAGSGSLLPDGANTITCVAADAAGNSTSATFVVTVLGAADQLALLQQAVIDLGIASDAQDGLLDKLAAAKRSLDDAHQRTACNQLDSFKRQVRAQSGKAIADTSDLLRRQAEIQAALDCVPSSALPVLLGPGAVVIAETSPGTASATILFTGPSDSVSCAPTSPASLGVGTTTTTCEAAGPTGTTTVMFDVTVVDREAPVLTVPADITVTAPFGSASAPVTYTATATDNAGPPTITCVPPSGSLFPGGTTTVSCTATDSSGNTSTGTFNVTVNVGSASIRGRVTDRATGAPIAGITVSAYDATAPCCATFILLGSAQTDANGEYRVALTRIASVKVLFNSPDPTGPAYIERWWSDKADIGTAGALFVNRELTNVNQSLDAGYRISGRVTDAGNPGVGVPNITVGAQPNFGCCFYFTKSDADGRYTLVVNAWTYRITFFGPVGTEFLAQAWNGKMSFGTANLLTVPSTTVDLSAINAALIRGIPITGIVTDATTGSPIDRVGVVATFEDPTFPCCLSYFAATGPDGRYTLYVGPGRHSVNFQPPGPYLFEYWNDKPDRTSANIIDVSGPTPNIDAALAKGFLISGRVTDAITGVGLGSAAVTISPITGSESFMVKLTDGAGSWSATVREGTYKIGFNGPFGTDYVLQYWSGKPDFATADMLVVNAARLNINAALARGFSVTGRVTDVSGNALPGANISAVTAGTLQFIASVAAGADGNYTLFLPVGDYVLSFSPPFPSDLLPEYWNDKADQASADVVHVAGPLSGMNAVLSPTR